MTSLLLALALAGIPFNCGNGFPAGAVCIRVTCSGGTCTEAAPLPAEFDTGSGGYLDLSGLAGWTATICADSGHTLVGAGELHVYGLSPWPAVSSLVWRDKALDLAVSSVTSNTACAGAACRCATWPDQEVALALNRKLRVIASGVTVSGGNLTIYLYGKSQ